MKELKRKTRKKEEKENDKKCFCPYCGKKLK